MKYNSLSKKNYTDNSDNDEEKFEFIKKKKYSESFLNFPFNEWIQIVKKIYSSDISLDTGKVYQRTVNKILNQDIFRKFKMDYEDGKKVIFLKEGILPDFLIQGIKFYEFKQIIDERKYMFQYGEYCNDLKNWPENADVTIIGEICNKLASKKREQINRYDEYINRHKYHILMLIFDFNYEHLFTSTLNFSNLQKLAYNKTPIVFGYIPKLFREDCYIAYNEIASINNKIEYKNFIRKEINESDLDILRKKADSSEEEILRLKAENEALKLENIKNKEEIDKLKTEVNKLEQKLEQKLIEKDESDKKRDEEMAKLKKMTEELLNNLHEQLNKNGTEKEKK